MKITRFTFCVLLTANMLVSGCAAVKLATENWGISKPVADPLAVWKRLYLDKQLDKAVVADSQDYIKNLPPNEQTYAGAEFFEDGTGQRAARITTGLKGTVWQHILIYDKDNKRIKTIKYTSGNYRS